jgi:hypothetical protein
MTQVSDLRDISSSALSIRPTAIFAYYDAITVWLKYPLSRAEIEQLKEQCGFGNERGFVHDCYLRPKFNPSLRQRLQLKQPRADALRSLSARADAYLNYAEAALDWVFEGDNEREEAYRLLDRYHLKNHHRDQGVRYERHDHQLTPPTRYTGPRMAANNFGLYVDKPCRVTGEVYCAHLEWRMRRPRNLRSTGLTGVGKLLELDLHGFWEERLLLRGLDLRKLGRMHLNSFRRIRRRSWVTVSRTGFRYDYDLATGALLANVFESTQKVADDFGRKFRVRECFVPIDVQHLLPPPDAKGLYL